MSWLEGDQLGGKGGGMGKGRRLRGTIGKGVDITPAFSVASYKCV